MSPRSPAANQLIKDARRDAIVRAATRVFARGGLAATRIGDIAAEAGISQGLLYHYFANKEAVFTWIVEDALRETAALTAGALGGPGPAWERLRQLCEEMLAGVLAYPEYPLVILQAFTSSVAPEGARAALERYGQQTFGDLVSLIQAGQAEGQVVQADPVELALAFTSCIQGIALSRLQSRAYGGWMPTAETILRLFKP